MIFDAYLAWAALAGAMFALIGVAYRMGKPRNLLPIHIVPFIALCGTVVFVVRTAGIDWSAVPSRVWVLGVTVGPTQYLAFTLIALALRMGPLVPVWCAVSMGFLPVAVYSALGLHEAVNAWQLLGLGGAIACVVAASFESRQQPSADAASRPGGVLRQTLYAVILGLVVVFNGFTGVAVKDLAARSLEGPTMLNAFGDVYFLLLYAGLTACVFVDLAVTRRFRMIHRGVWLPALIGGIGSVGGILSTARYADGPGMTVFAVSGICGIFATTALARVIFGEKLTAVRVVSVLLGCLSIGLYAAGGSGAPPAAGKDDKPAL
jgi:hypothetical protein